MKLILALTALVICSPSFGQTLSTKRADNVTDLIDKDTILKATVISLDTLHYAYGAMVKTEVSFIAYTDPRTNHVVKIAWNNEGDYYLFVTIYYYRGSAIKAIIKAKYRQTDTNPEFETNSVFYFKKDKVAKEKEFNGNTYRANGFWYLSTVNDFIKLAGLKLR